MAKKRKTPEGKELAQLRSDREWLIRTTRIGMGYVSQAIKAAQDTGDAKALQVYGSHMAAMEMALDATVPPANDVLALLGGEVSRLRTGIHDAIEQMAGENSVCGTCGGEDSTDGCDVQIELKSLLAKTTKPACGTCGGGRRIYPTHPDADGGCYVQIDSPDVCRCGVGRPCPDCAEVSV